MIIIFLFIVMLCFKHIFLHYHIFIGENLFFIHDNLWKSFFLFMIISENLIKPFLSVKIFSYLCSSFKIFSIYLCSSFEVAVFGIHFWGSNFKEYPCCKCIFWGINFKAHPCFEVPVLREQLFLFLDSWLLISVAAALWFLLKSSRQAKLLQFWHV